ncbi:response regulator [Paenibacillus sinopodophylli]|uniref:response regulator n=1 Tax=Paenibacillus sinopodophylli TaxID=1837342 RepID=UPI00110CE4FC|nr:response regulator [Paenibacillus sinopodophylli]
MTYFLILFIAALLAAVSFVFYQQRKMEKGQRSTERESALHIPAELVKLTSSVGTQAKATVKEELQTERRSRDYGDDVHLLVVDDQYSIRLMLTELFLATGVRVFEAESGAEALAICGEQQLHCILLDLKLPDMDGIGILGGIRSISESVPVVLITAYASPDKLEEALELGISKCYTKPFDIIELKNDVLQLIDKHTMQRSI